MTRNDRMAENRLAAIPRLDLASLRSEWTALHGRPPPARLSRDLLARAVAYGIQVKVHGGLRPALLRTLERIAEGDDAASVTSGSAPRFSPGVRLMREWNGETHVVEVLADGFHWNGARYRSLSSVARAITGARWSGPRFFGLDEAARSSGSHAETER